MINCNFISNNAINSGGGGLYILDYNIIKFLHISFGDNKAS